MNIPFLGRAVDERFLMHRLRSTSTAGIIGAVLALLLFLYRLQFDRVWNWDLLAIGVTVAVVKMALMTYYFLTD